MAGQFAALGVSVAADPVTAIDILPPNHGSVRAWLECQTQWRRTGLMSGLIYDGLDYPSVRLVLDDLGAAPGVFADIRHMERVALPILNDRD